MTDEIKIHINGLKCNVLSPLVEIEGICISYCYQLISGPLASKLHIIIESMEEEKAEPR